MRVRVSRESVNEVQDLISPTPTSLVPNPIGQHAGNDGQRERGDETQSPPCCKRAGRKQKQGSGYRQTYLVREHGSEKNGVAMFHKELDDSIHI
jgi:hypothetical protein